MNNDLISIIVPCYNVEKYLSQCVDSLLNQTYKNLEIILVDDGSIDSTPALCDSFTKADSRISVIHKENGGLSDARNYGIKKATGEYLVFIDSDDYFNTQVLEVAITKCKQQNSDLVVWGYQADFEDQNGELLRSIPHSLSGALKKGDTASLPLKREALGLSGYAWNKLYKTDIIKNNNLLFEKGISLVEDILFNSLYFCCCENIEFIDLVGTHYIQRPRITLGTKYYENMFDLKLLACEAHEKILNHFDIGNTEIVEVMASSYYSAVKAGVTNITKSGANLSELKAFLSDSLVQEIAKKATVKSLKQRLLITLVRLKQARLIIKLKL